MWDLDRVFKVAGIVASVVTTAVGVTILAEKFMGDKSAPAANANNANAKAA